MLQKRLYFLGYILLFGIATKKPHSNPWHQSSSIDIMHSYWCTNEKAILNYSLSCWKLCVLHMLPLYSMQSHRGCGTHAVCIQIHTIELIVSQMYCCIQCTVFTCFTGLMLRTETNSSQLFAWFVCKKLFSHSPKLW